MQTIIADLLVQDPADKETQLTLARETAIQAAKLEKPVACSSPDIITLNSPSPYLRRCRTGKRITGPGRHLGGLA